MRVSFLVLAGVIAVCSINASAKAVAPAAEDEGVGQSPGEQDPQNDTAHETAVNRSNVGEHVLNRRRASPDSGKRRSVVKKKSDKKRKTESKKFESKKFEEHKTKSVKNKTSSKRTEKRESQAKNRSGFLSNDWFMPQYNSKTLSVPVIYRDPHKYHVPLALQANFAANLVNSDHENKALPAKELMKVEELAEIFHNSLRGGMESLFSVLAKELRKKIDQTNAKPASNANTRSTSVEVDEGPWEGESQVSADGVTAIDYCSDDTPPTANESGDGTGPRDVCKRSGGSPLEYLQETIPAVVQAVKSILAESLANAGPPGANGVVGDYGMYERKSSDAGVEAVVSAPDYGPDDAVWGSSFYDDSYANDDFGKWSDFVSRDTSPVPATKNGGDAYFPQQ